MSYCTRRSESSTSRRSQCSQDGDTTTEDGDERDETKRRSRNLSEKKRRDQFNILINELNGMVTTTSRKMDKSTVLKAAIAFLKAHNELSVQSQVQETQEDWKPSFLSNEEFTHLMLEALDGFVVVISNTGKMLYLSESITSLLGHLPSNLVNTSVYDYIPMEEKPAMYTVLSGPADNKSRGSVSIIINFKLGGLEMNEENENYQLVKFVGYYKLWISTSECESEGTERSEGEYSESSDSTNSSNIFIATGRLIDSDLLREMSVVVDCAKSEFSSRHSLEWKFLFLDHRAPPIIGYLPFEVLGTSGYDYYHVEDLEKIAACHEALMQKGEGTSCYYRFLTKGQQWIWLQTRYYITYHQWNAKPEFIVCTHRVVSYADVMKELGRGIVKDEVPSSSHRHSGPTPPKQARMDYRKSHSCSFKHSSRHQHGRHHSHSDANDGVNYGSMSSKHNKYIRKLDLPPKFMTSMSPSHPGSVPTPHQHSADQMGDLIPEQGPCVTICQPQFNNTVTVLHPQFPQFVQSAQPVTPAQPTTGATMALPIATFQLKPLPTTPAFSIASTPSMGQTNLAPGHTLLPSQCLLQEQLMLKHAELQRQILQQQEELRRISEQLIIAQCGLIPGEASILIPQHISPSDGQPPANETVALQHQLPDHNSGRPMHQSYANVQVYQPSVVGFTDPHQPSHQHQRIGEGHPFAAYLPQEK